MSVTSNCDIGENELTLIIPAFQEQDILLSSLRRLGDYFNNRQVEILIIDDGSIGATSEEAIKFINHNPKARLIKES
jgi:glycosyltransferase involved in cell wall biosynthesis